MRVCLWSKVIQAQRVRGVLPPTSQKTKRLPKSPALRLLGRCPTPLVRPHFARSRKFSCSLIFQKRMILHPELKRFLLFSFNCYLLLTPEL